MEHDIDSCPHNIEISDRSEPKILQVMLKVNKNVTENLYLPDFRGGVRLFRPPKSASANYFASRDRNDCFDLISS